MLPIPAPHGKTVPFLTDFWADDHPDRRRLDARLEPDHLARKVDRLVDSLDLDSLLLLYTGFGSLPYPPQLLLKAVLFEVHRGIHSPAHWCRDAHESEPLRWLLRGLEPSRSRWYAFRDRLDPELLHTLNAQISVRARQENLTRGTRGSLDGSTVAANASRRRLLNLTTVQARLVELRRACTADQRGETVMNRPAWMARKRGRRHQLDIYERAEKRLRQRQLDNDQKRACDRVESKRIRLAIGDTDAVPGLDKEDVYRPLYNVQLLQDLDSPLILAYDVFAQVSDVGTLAPLLTRAREQGWQVEDLLTDSTYATGPHLALAEQEDIVVYAPWQEQTPGQGKGSVKPPPWLPKEEFIYLAGQRVYLCPTGKRLELEQVRTQQRSEGERVRLEVYRCRGSDCQECPLAVWCTSNPPAGRTVSRSEHEELFEQLRQRMETEEGQELYRLRQQTVELGFADVKQHRRMRRFSGRGLEHVRTEVGLCVLAHNGLAVDKARQGREKTAA